ncbi:hypothetical protein COLO4_31184 [Corchorus olitorius]|uniref:Uncharacterized protein n=1 Tax=Corchorus olitorius TaxID=93759 RepID=A0A1R3H5A0_9ROSI|nr:hypothetical protein COLO4_31184 [Corchorus olitorius]
MTDESNRKGPTKSFQSRHNRATTTADVSWSLISRQDLTSSSTTRVSDTSAF